MTPWIAVLVVAGIVTCGASETNALPKIPTIKLATGEHIQLMGISTATADEETEHEAVYRSIELGFRYIDCAESPALLDGVAKGLQDAISSGLVTREELWVSGRVFPTRMDPKGVEWSIKATLEKLQMDYLDMVVIHWPHRMRHGSEVPISETEFIGYSLDLIQETWRALERAVDRGLVRRLAVANFSLKKLDDVIAIARHKPAMNQVEMHPALAQPKLLHGCHERGVQVAAMFPTGMVGPIDPPEETSDGAEPQQPRPLQHPLIQGLAEEYGATVSQIILAWGRRRGTVLLPYWSDALHIEEALHSLEVQLSTEAMAAIDSLDIHDRILHGEYLVPEDIPWQNIWDENLEPMEPEFHIKKATNARRMKTKFASKDSDADADADASGEHTEL